MPVHDTNVPRIVRSTQEQRNKMINCAVVFRHWLAANPAPYISMLIGLPNDLLGYIFSRVGPAIVEPPRPSAMYIRHVLIWFFTPAPPVSLAYLFTVGTLPLIGTYLQPFPILGGCSIAISGLSIVFFTVS